jgi:hypothetical protein
MKIENPLICVATQKDAANKTSIFDSIKKYDINSRYFLKNKESLPTVYNLAITKALKDDVDWLILAHDDIHLLSDPIERLEELDGKFDLVGVAGTSKIELKSPALWHLMGGGFNGGNLHGFVYHDIDNNRYPSQFGYYPNRVVMIDGVFIAMNRKVMEKMRFDESNPAKFHFYDLDFSLNCHMNGYKVGVGHVLITHESPGLREFTDEWKAGEKYFLNKYK